MTDQATPNPADPASPLAAFDELLKRPTAAIERPPGASSRQSSWWLLAGAVACWLIYGAASGFFQGGWQVVFAAVKAPIIIGAAVLICLPSLYILSALTGAEVGGRRLLVIVAGFAGMLGIFMAGLMPIAWLFSVSSRSLPFMVWLHLGLWIVTAGLAGRYLGTALRASGGQATIAPWVLLFLVVSFQTATLLRPTLWRPEGAPLLPGLSEKLSFLEHFSRSMAPPAIAEGDEVDASAALSTVVDTDRAFARAAAAKGLVGASLEFLAEEALVFEPALGSAKLHLRSHQGKGPAREWEPRTGDVSRNGDLAWTAGPFTDRLADGPRHGLYLTVWKRQSDGSWRAMFTVPTTAPAPVDFPEGFRRAGEEGGRYRRKSHDDTGVEALVEEERRLQTLETRWLASAFRDDGRLHLPGEGAFAGVDAIRKRLERGALPLASTSMASTAARSGDLGYAYGRYLRPPHESGPGPQQGHYLRVYKRWPSGNWAIVAQVLQERGQGFSAGAHDSSGGPE